MGQTGLGKYIRSKRSNLITLRAFAEEIGVSASYMSDVERGRRNVNKEMLIRIVCALGRTVGGDIHHYYDTMLMLSGHLTPERECLKALWGSFKARNGDALFKLWEGHAYEALYEDLDIAFYGYPIRKVPPPVADAEPFPESDEK